MTFVLCADGSNEFCIRVAEKSHRIRIQRNVRPVFLAVARHPLKKFLAFFRRLDTDTEDLHLSFKVAFPLVDKGRHLGPAPWSPAATVKENHRSRGLFEDIGKFDGDSINVIQRYRWKQVTRC